MMSGGSSRANKIQNWLLWAVSVLFMTFLYRDGLRAWFIADDFAWLGLLRGVHNPNDLLRAMFEPAAQGTIRPWSERGFFLLYESLFGIDSLPFRITAWATFALDLALLSWVVRRMTGSRVAGLAAAIMWTSNAALATAMTWSSAWNELLCPLFLLSALALFIRYTETGDRRLWWSQVVVFVLGFGALEINVVYPALALGWAVIVVPAERRARMAIRAAWLFPVSVLYFAIHTWAAPIPKTGGYGVHVDARILHTLFLYLKFSLLPQDWAAFGHQVWLGKAILIFGALSLLALVAVELRAGKRAVLFGVVWYLATLSPVLILPDHITDYYLTIPLAGLGMVAAVGFSGSRIRQAWTAAAVTTYVCASAPVALAATRWHQQQSEQVRVLVLGVEAAHEAHPGKAILLEGLTPALYINSIGQSALYPLGIDEVYLTPGSEKEIEVTGGVADTAKTVLEPETAIHAIRAGQALVYRIAGDHLRNITSLYSLTAPAKFPGAETGAPSRVDPGNRLYAWTLGTGWAKPEDGVVWMRGRAFLQIKSPSQPGWKLSIEGFLQDEQLKTAPRHLRVAADGIEIGTAKISDPETTFQRLFPLPDTLAGRKVLNLEIQIDPVARKGGEDYGALFGKIGLVR